MGVKIVSTQSKRILERCAAAAAALVMVATGQAVALRSWDAKINDVNERFVVLESFDNLAVLDKETQLVWFRKSGSATTWTDANEGCGYARVDFRNGWRLPSLRELSSLQGSNAALPPGHPFTEMGAGDFLWSTTRHVTDSDSVYVRLLAGYGGAGVRPKGKLARYLCVRGVGVVVRN